MRNTQKFNEALDACGMRKIFEAYNVTAKDLKPGDIDNWQYSYIYKRGDLTFIYNTDCKEVFLNLKTNIGGLNFRIDPRGHFWFVLDAWKVTKRNLLNLDVKPILEILSIIGGEIYVTKDPNNKNCFKFKNYYEDGAVNLKDLPMLAHAL